MGRLRWSFGFVGSLLMLAGCSRIDENILIPFPGEDSTGGTPTTTTSSNESNLFDGVGGQPPGCCVNGPDPPFEALSYFQFGAPGTLGPCPNATTPGLTGYQEMKPLEPHTCGACTCSPATCTVPEGIHTNAAKRANADGSVAIPFDPDPAGAWSGACSDAAALPAGLQCNGIPCVQSVTVPALSVAPCEPTSDATDPFPAPTWGRMARECVAAPLSADGCEPGQVCVPEPPGGLTLCLHLHGDHPTCPPDYPARTVFYMSEQDGRGCEACECAAPSGAQCLAVVQTFSDAACGTFAGGVLATAQEAACFDVVSGTALGSAEATMVTGMAGSCAPSGGAPFGQVEPADPFTLCCQGDPAPPG